MAYFDCIVGGSGKGNTLVVTCADDLAGATITCTNGTKTYNKTCPSTSPYEVTFYGLEAGTWTVSATVSGNTYTATVVVVDCTALLGGFNWRTWVDTAQFLDSTDYNSLDEVLADEEAVRELCLEHACVDYLANIATVSADVETIIENDLFAKWVNNSDYALDFLGANTVIKALMDEADKYFYGEWVITDDTTTPPTWGAKGNVPVMTGNTAPYGTVSAYKTGTSYGYNAWKAFDGDDSGTYYSNAAARTTSDYLQYKFVNPVCVKKVRVKKHTVASTLTVLKIRASNDGTNFVDLGTIDVTTIDDNSVNINNTDYYLYYRIQNNDNSSEWFSIDTVQFYGRELKVSVPTMTSNTAPYGTASGSSEYSANNMAFKAFDNSTSTMWHSNAGTPQWIRYDFNTPICLRFVVLKTGTIVGPKTSKLQGYDGANWVDIDDFINCPSASSTYYKSVSSSTAYESIRLNVTESNYLSNGQQYVAISELQFYGEDYSEKEFEVGTTKKWLYDHGVELAEFETTKGSTTTSAVPYNDGSELYSPTLAGTKNSVGTFVGIGISINLSNYNMVRSVIGSRLKGAGNSYNSAGEITAWASKPTGQYNSGDRIAAKDLLLPLDGSPYEFSIDVSAVNALVFLGLFETYYTGRENSIKELWLE